jgi:hypothetical protein
MVLSSQPAGTQMRLPSISTMRTKPNGGLKLCFETLCYAINHSLTALSGNASAHRLTDPPVPSDTSESLQVRAR